MPDLHDLSPMPFGPYAGTPMRRVPAVHLNQLWNSGLCRKSRDRVARYIRHAWRQLRAETPRLNWN